MSTKTGMRTVFQRQLVDKDSGEVLTDTKVEVQMPVPGEEFAFVYLDALVPLLRLDGLAVKAWVWCCLRAEAGSGIIHIGEEERAQIAKLADVRGKGSVSKSLAQLVQAGVLARKGPGRYLLNPEYAWRGRVQGRGKARQKWAGVK